MKTEWNGEYYVSYSQDRNWEEARRYGFVRGGGDDWYSRTLRRLQPGDRIWVRIPGIGYVGVGRVIEAPRPASEFTISGQPVAGVLACDVKDRFHIRDPKRWEWFVRVKWLGDTKGESDAVNEAGLFANTNTACKPTVPNWNATVERLKADFPKWNSDAETR